MSFFDEFNHIVPYTIRVNVGGNRQYKTDTSNKTNKNHKGKMVAVYKRAETAEELEKYGMGEFTTYVPAEQISMPIDIQVVSDETLTPKFEKTSKYTNRESTEHEIRIFNKDGAQVGYVCLSLTPAGDISRKTCFYENPEKTEKIMHTSHSEIQDGKMIKDDNFKFKKDSETGTKKVRISQRNGKVVGSSIMEQDIETREDVLCQSIIQLGKDENTPKLRTYVTSCVTDETERKKRGGTLIPRECRTLERDLYQYQSTMENFNQIAEWIKQQTGEEITIERALENDKLSYKERKEKGIRYPRLFNDGNYADKARYLADSNNDFLREFKGKYIGNILRLTDKGYEACIVTKHQKDNKDYKLYTLVDLTGTSITQGTGEEAYMDIVGRDSKYFQRLREADKTPTFVTQVNQNGSEELVLYNGKAISEECPEYEEFVTKFIAPFSEIEPIQIGKILNRQNQEMK